MVLSSEFFFEKHYDIKQKKGTGAESCKNLRNLSLLDTNYGCIISVFIHFQAQTNFQSAQTLKIFAFMFNNRFVLLKHVRKKSFREANVGLSCKSIALFSFGFFAKKFSENPFMIKQFLCCYLLVFAVGLLSEKIELAPRMKNVIKKRLEAKKMHDKVYVFIVQLYR